MLRTTPVLLALTLSTLSTTLLPLFAESDAKPMTLVREHKPAAALILPDNADAALQHLARTFVATVARSTGAELPILQESDADSARIEARIFIGPTQRAKAEGIEPKTLPEEGYRIIRRGSALFVVGHDTPRKEGIERQHPVSQPTRWALNRLLEESLGVRWLWPGELGTYVPKQATMQTAIDDLSHRPALRSRQLVPAWTLYTARRDRPGGRLTPEERHAILTAEQPIIQEGIDWLENHEGGERGNVPMPSHAFNKWWERYGKEHPEFFAQPPPGEQYPMHRPAAIKLRLSNPAVIEQIAREYQAAGAPPYWPMTPSDAAGYDTSEETRAWDIPQGQPIMDIWKGRANLTARYVTFWNRVYDRLKQINPDVTLTAYAYSAYRNPPPPERKLTARMKMGVVSAYNKEAYTIWQGWAALVQEGGMVLRPNWWHIRSNAPHLPLDEFTSFIKFTQKHQLDGIRMDSILGDWGTKGASYYLVARLLSHPHLSKDEILAEYTSAFGKGGPKIREYLDYWQHVTTEQDALRSPVPEVQAFLDEIRQGVYLINSSALQSLFLPSLYPEAVVAPARKLLEEAAAEIGDTDREALARVDFLKAGLMEFETARDTIALGLEINEATLAQRKPNPETVAAFEKSAAELAKLRAEFGQQHVIWSGPAYRREYRRRVPTTPKTLKSPQILRRNPNPTANEDINDV